MATRYNISKPRKYTDSNGQEKTYWDKVGELVEIQKADGSISRIIKIPAIGLEANAFEDKPKEAAPKPATTSTEEINPEDIPF